MTWLSKTTKHIKQPQTILFACAFILIAILRLTNITQTPPGFYKDEAGIAVNGYSILKTGKDEYGRILPLFFENFGDFKEPIFIYSQLPAMLIWGYDITATRITAGLWGLATILVFCYLIKIKLKNDWLVIVGLLVLGLMPWHIHFSRIGFQLITLPFFFTLFLIFYIKLIQSHNSKYLTAIAITCASMFYTYYAGRYLAIVYLLFTIWMTRKIFHYKYFVRSIIIFAMILIPVIIWSEKYPNLLTARFNTVSIIQRDNSIEQIVNQYISGYLQHYSLDFWFVIGDRNVRHSVQYHYPLLWAMIPFSISGLYCLVRHRKDKFNQLILFTIVTFPAVSALTKDAPHIHRIIFMVPIVSYVLTIGIKEIIIILARKKMAIQYGIIALWLIIVIIESIDVYHYYHSDYAYRAKPWFHVNDIAAIEKLLEYPKPHIISFAVAEYRMSTYHLVAQINPEQLHQGLSDVHSENIYNLSKYRSGHYLVGGEECNALPTMFSNTQLLEKIHEFCIYRVQL